MLRELSVANGGPTVKINIGVTDILSEGVMFFSAFDYSSRIKSLERTMKKKFNAYFLGRSFTIYGNNYKVYATHLSNSDYSHLIAYKKDAVVKSSSGEEVIHAGIFFHTEEPFVDNLSMMRTTYGFPQILVDAVYDKLAKLSPAPVLKEWMPYLMDSFVMNSHIRSAYVFNGNEEDKTFHAYVLGINMADLIDTISTGLRMHDITIDGDTGRSETMDAIEGIDAYLNTFSEKLTEKIQTSFKPQFTPQVDAYSPVLKDVCDYMAYHGRMVPYHAQMDVMQAVANSWEKNKSAFIVGEQGAGKTAMAIGSVMTANKDEHTMTNIVQCPGHLVNKWKREIERLAPQSEAYIVSDFDDILDLKDKIMDRKRYRHLWLILSKETSKFGYEERPAAVWNEAKHCYCCPDCGKPLFYLKKEGKGRRARYIHVYLGRKDFLKKDAKNVVCCNKVKVWNKDKGDWDEELCNSKLWQPAMKEQLTDDERPGGSWVKLGKAGWMERRHIQVMYDKLMNAPELKADETKLLDALAAFMEEEPKQHAPRKYPIARYIRRTFKGYIDYVIVDEAHQYKAKDSLQGQAMGDLVSTGKKVLALTGTLLNGYASGIYYILFRLFAKQMKDEGYDYSSDAEFAKDYGVTRRSRWYEMHNGRVGDAAGTSKVKELPGVSPIVFTKFLLGNAAFISLEDIAEALPGYQEIPVAVNMDYDIEQHYKDLANQAKSVMTSNREGCGQKIMGQVIQLLSVYPDTPVGQPDVINPETGDVEISVGRSDELANCPRHKEESVLQIVQDKIEKGEKVLVYYNWTNRSDVAARLTNLFETHGIKSAVLTSSVKSQNRETWIQKQVQENDIDVLMCNPTLVETGLDLLDFTTIIYYQVGYNLFTLRQSSRRSWRINQTHDVEVYFLYYRDTVQEQALSLMATKLQASQAIEGKFSEEGLQAMSNNEDVLTQIASAVAGDIEATVDVQVFQKNDTKAAAKKAEEKSKEAYQPPTLSSYSFYDMPDEKKKKATHMKSMNEAEKKILEQPSILMVA